MKLILTIKKPVRYVIRKSVNRSKNHLTLRLHHRPGHAVFWQQHWVKNATINSAHQLSQEGKTGLRAARIFNSFLGKSFVNKATGYYWEPKESDFLKVICKKLGNNPKGGSSDPNIRSITFQEVLKENVDASSTPGFIDRRAEFIQHIPQLIQNPDAIYEGIQGSDKGKIAFVKYIKGSNPSWIGVKVMKKNNRNTAMQNQSGNIEIAPISHIVKKSLSGNWLKRYKQIWP